MAQNYIQKGDTITVPGDAMTIQGSIYIQGRIKGVVVAQEAWRSMDIGIRGVYALTKTEASAFALGDPVYATHGGNATDDEESVLMGTCVKAAPAGSATVETLLNV